MRLRLIPVACAIFFINQSGSAQLTISEKKDSALLTVKMKAFVSDFNNLNWESFRANFDEEITAFVESDTLTLMRGKKAVEQLFKTIFDEVRQNAKGPPYLHIQPENMIIQMMAGTSVVTFHIVRGNTIARRTFVWRKRKNNWLIIHIHGSAAEP